MSGRPLERFDFVPGGGDGLVAVVATAEPCGFTACFADLFGEPLGMDAIAGYEGDSVT